MLDVAVFAEHSDSNKPMTAQSGAFAGWNPRVFNRTEVAPVSAAIRLEPETGTVVLRRGFYHLQAVSMVSYFDPKLGGVPVVNPALGGYCRLRDAARPGCASPELCGNEDAVAIGTMSTANLLPSFIDAYLRVDAAEARLVLEHQVGAEVENVLLQLYVVNSTWHVMARLSITRLDESGASCRPVEPVAARITEQLAPLSAPGSRVSAVNRLFGAALGEYLDLRSGAAYDQLYAWYMGIEPRFRPRSADCDPWPAADEPEVRALLERGRIRFGYVAGAPYVYTEGTALTGFDHNLGTALAGIITQHYRPDGPVLDVEWKELPLPEGDEQAGKLASLCAGLANGDFDLALSGQMMLPADYLPAGYTLEWTAPTAYLFTGITYNGRDRDRLDLARLAALRSTHLDAFLSYAVAESQRLGLELRFFAVTNPGPSPGAAQAVVAGINAAGGRAVWDIGTVAQSNQVMLEGLDHFSVGDSLATAATTLLEGFEGLYLNIAANLESGQGEEGSTKTYVGLWPLAAFTATFSPPLLVSSSDHHEEIP